MNLPNARMIRLAWVVALLSLAAGCSPTRVTFDGPPGTVMFVDHKPYHLPAQIELWRPAGDGQSNRYDVSLAFPTAQSQEVRAKGHIDVFGYTESDVDKMAANTCKLDESELIKVLDGKILIFKGSSASRQPIYDLTLAKE